MSNLEKKVLIVEDDKDFLWILKQSFAGQGFSVIFAEDGEEGLKMAENEKPDLIILDILLPKMDGITVAKKLKERGVKSPIIFLSNLMGKLPVVEGIVRETDYIVKSDLHVDQIIARVKERLGVK
jgi:DNA-binding response OmpR family regulator